MQADAERVLGRLVLAAGQPTEAEQYVRDALGRLVAKGFALDIPESRWDPTATTPRLPRAPHWKPDEAVGSGS